MSHVSKIEGVEIRDLNALASACERIGMELVRDARTFRAYYGNNQCSHKIRVKGDSSAYEIGVTKNADGSMSLNWDTWGNEGRKLIDRIGQQGEIVKRHYAAELGKSIARRKGFHVQEQQLENGAIRLKIRKGAGSW